MKSAKACAMTINTGLSRIKVALIVIIAIIADIRVLILDFPRDMVFERNGSTERFI